MSCKRQLFRDRKNADSLSLLCFNLRLARQDESCFREIHLASERLHLLIGKTASVSKNGERITGERCSRKNIELHEFVTTGYASVFSLATINSVKERGSNGALRSQLSTSSILLLADVLHPLDHLPVKRFLNGDMRHRGRRRSAVPMLLVRCKPNDIAWPDFRDRAAPTLRPPKPGRYDQRLTEWMRVPCGAGTLLERDACTGHACGIGCLE
jgi:hypothetical protein